MWLNIKKYDNFARISLFLFMDRKELIGFVLKDIKELELIVKGMHEMEKIPEAVQELVISKTESILEHFRSLKGSTFANKFPEVKIPEIKIPEQKEPEVKKSEPVLTVTTNRKEKDIVVNPPKEPDPKEPEKVNKGGVTTNEKFKSQAPPLNTVVATGKKAESRFVHSLRKAINLNDRYRYLRDLFGGDIELMNRVIEKLDTMKTLSEAMDCVQREFSWDSQSETVADFYSLLENRFS